MQSKNKKRSATDFMPDDEKSMSILRERASQIAKQAIDTAQKKEEVPYIRFRLGANEKYGIAYSYAKEVMAYSLLTSVPCVPNFVAGVINRRGAIITVLDLKKLFQIKTSEKETENHAGIIIVKCHNTMMGLIADEIEGSDRYDPATLDNPMPSEKITKLEYFVGLHQGRITLLNIETILSDAELQLAKEK